MDGPTIFAVLVSLLAIANVWVGDHSWAPYFFRPLTTVAALYVLIVGALRYLGSGTIASPAFEISLWIGMFLISAQFAYLYFSIETWRDRRYEQKHHCSEE